MYAALDAVMKLAIDNPLNRLRFGRVDMCDRVLEGLDRYCRFCTCVFRVSCPERIRLTVSWA